MPRSYPPEFRHRALQRINAGNSVVSVAHDLDVSDSSELPLCERRAVPAKVVGVVVVPDVNSTLPHSSHRHLRELRIERWDCPGVS